MMCFLGCLVILEKHERPLKIDTLNFELKKYQKSQSSLRLKLAVSKSKYSKGILLFCPLDFLQNGLILHLQNLMV